MILIDTKSINLVLKYIYKIKNIPRKILRKIESEGWRSFDGWNFSEIRGFWKRDKSRNFSTKQSYREECALSLPY